MDECITLSLQDLIASGCISESAFVFDQEDDLSEISGSVKRESSEDELCHLNAAKVSLLLSKEVFDRYPTTNEISLTSLHSSNIFLRLKCYSELDADAGSRPELENAPTPDNDNGKEPIGSAQAHPAHRSSNLFANGCDHKDQGGSTQHRQIYSSSSSSFDAALDEIFEEASESKHEDESSKIFRKKSDSTIFVVDAGTKYSPARRMRIPITDMDQFRSIDEANKRKLHFTLISVEIILNPLNDGSPPPSSTEVSSLAATLQALGNLIQPVFSQNNEPLAPTYPTSVSAEVNDAGIVEDASLPRHSKIRRNRDVSLFSSLVESDRYPISICRLLSDMIDVGPNGKADAPYASFDEVIHDLEQISFYPETFLCDRENSLYSPSLLFGQRCYGREAEVTKILEISTRLEQSIQSRCEDSLVETVFVTGIAGCGKTQIARRVGSFLSSLGWIVLEAKFDRCTEYQSREVICSVFDKLVTKFVDMKEGSDENDKEYAARAEQAISDTFDAATLSTLADFIPSIHNFFGDIHKNMNKKDAHRGGIDASRWQLIILLSRFLGTILRLGRFIMICLDDLQWCDSGMLTLINEIIAAVAQCDQESQHFLFVGTYRNDEIDNVHPLADRLSNLERNTRINVTHVHLTSFSRDEVCHMLMAEMRLPRRLVYGLADAVHKKTSGHAIFVVELLNLLLRESTILYSPQLLRFDWDPDKVSAVKTGDNVASLIISNLTSLQPLVLWTLCVISCFGFKSETRLLRLLKGSSIYPDGGFDLVSLVEHGFVELSGSVVSFSHDLIHQYVYEKMPVNKRQKLHSDIGTALAAKTTLDSRISHQPIEATMEQLFLCDGGDEQDDDSSMSVISLSGIATSQINKASPEFISDRIRRIRFAGWNLQASNESAGKSNFRAALYYCRNGLMFLGEDPWLVETCQLSIELHEGAALASFAVGSVEDAVEYTDAIIDSENVDFEQSLAAHYMLLRSLETLGHYDDTIARGLAVLRRLNFDIPTDASPPFIMQTMLETGNIASQYRNVNNSSLPQVIHPKQTNILKIIDSVAVACYLSASPYLPLMACATLIYSLQQGIFHCEESASAFAIFGYFKVFLEGDLAEGKRWGDLTIAILENSGGHSVARARIYLYGCLYFWYIPIQETNRRLHETYTLSMRCGDVDSAMMALCLDWRCQFFGGHKLSVVRSNYAEYMKLMTKYSKELLKQGVMRKINLDELMGISDEDPFLLLESTVCNDADLLAHAKLINNIQLIEEVHLTHFLSAFWMGNYIKAMESFRLIAALPSSKMPKIQALYYTFYWGIVAYQLFRDGIGEHLLAEGNAVLSKVQSWRQTCDHVENKLLLLEAEYFASICVIKSAKEKYEASIKSARDHGFLHEQGLAYECMGKYLSSIVELPEAKQCFRRAHVCYMQWGALGKAEQIQREHGFEEVCESSNEGAMKNQRDWEEML